MKIIKGQKVEVKGKVGGKWQECTAREDFNLEDERWKLLVWNDEAKQMIEFEPLSDRCVLRVKQEGGKFKVARSDIDIWGELKEIISKSNIKRYPWKLILGDSLTKTILRKKMSDKSAQETYNEILASDRFLEIKKAFPEHARKMEENVFISVCARYGENNTALSLFRKEFSK